MDQNAGIAGLAPAAPQQPPAASGVQSYVAPLMGMDMQRLLMEFNNPGSRFPKFAVLSAMQEKQKQAQMRQAMQGQQAMAQNAQQGQAPVAAGILAGAQAEAAQEAPVQRMSAGGAVAFQTGGSPLFKDPLLGEYTLQANVGNESEEEYARRKKEAEEAAMTPLERLLRAVEAPTGSPLRRALYPDRTPQRGLTPTPQELERQVTAAPVARTPQEIEKLVSTPEGTSYQPEPFAGPSRPPQAARPGAGAPGAVKTPGTVAAQGMDDIVALTKAQEERNKARLELAKTTPEVTAARATEQRTMQENLKAALDEAKTAREAAEKRRADVVGAASRSIAEDPEALFRLAGAMNTRRGMGIGSLAGAAGAELGRRREAIQAAEKEFAGEQKELRALDAANRQYNLSVVQLQKAYAEGDAEKIRAAKQDVADSAVALQEKKMDFKLKQREVGAKEMGAQAQMIAAGKPTSQEALINFFRTDPQGFAKFIATQVEPKNEGSLAKALVVEAVKNPAMLGIVKENSPALYSLIQMEIAKLGMTTSAPTGPVRE